MKYFITIKHMRAMYKHLAIRVLDCI